MVSRTSLYRKNCPSLTERVFQDRLSEFRSIGITPDLLATGGDGFRSANSLALDDPYQHGNDGNNKEQVNEATHRVR